MNHSDLTRKDILHSLGYHHRRHQDTYPMSHKGLNYELFPTHLAAHLHHYRGNLEFREMKNSGIQ